MNQQYYLNKNMLNWNREDMKLAWLCSEYTTYINGYVIHINEPLNPSKQKHEQRKRTRHEACVTLHLRTTPTHHPPILPTPVQWKWEMDCVCIENRKPPPLEGRSLLPSWNLATCEPPATCEVAKTTEWLFSWEILTALNPHSPWAVRISQLKSPWVLLEPPSVAKFQIFSAEH